MKEVLSIIYTDGPQRLETQGQGPIERGKARDMDGEYAYALVATGQVQLATDAAREKYAVIRKRKIDEAVAADQGARQKNPDLKPALFYCDGCFNEVPLADISAGFCPFCNPRPVEEN
jgi:hypothetical protein